MSNENKVILRELRGEDTTLLLRWENNQENWRVSDRTKSLVKADIELLIESQQNAESPYALDQFRYMICEAGSGRPLGTIDFYEADWKVDSTYLGILIANPADRSSGFGSQALELFLEKLHDEFDLTTVKVRIQPDNMGSIRFFERAGFRKKNNEKHLNEQDADYIEFVRELEKK
ncbi:MAG: GNAT family N-acetyltransferase [Fluviicola sp.]